MRHRSIAFYLCSICIMLCAVVLLALPTGTVEAKNFKGKGASSFHGWKSGVSRRPLASLDAFRKNRQFKKTSPAFGHGKWKHEKLGKRGKRKGVHGLKKRRRFQARHIRRGFIYPFAGYRTYSPEVYVIRDSNDVDTDREEGFKGVPRPDFQAKLIHIGEDGGVLTGTDGNQPETVKDAQLANCLSVRTSIVIDGEEVEAFGEACIDAQGNWRLRPQE